MLHLHSSNRLETLVDMLADVVANPLPSPLHREFIVVQSKGMERWLSLELAQRLGVWANARYPFPKTIIWQLLRAVLSQDDSINYFETQEPHYFDPELLQWGVMQVLPTLLDDPDFSEIQQYLQEDTHDVKLFQLSQRVADLLDQYVVYRPQWIEAWEQDKVLSDLLSSGKTLTWQTKLWQALIQKYGNEHYAALYEKFKTRLAEPTFHSPYLPKRLSIFGIHALPPFYIDVFEKLSAVVEVHVFSLNPCQEYWGDILSDTEIAHRIARRYKKPNTPETLYFTKGNNLLASWGQVGRDFIDILLQYDADDEYDIIIDEPPHNLLAHLQSEILHLTEFPHGKADAALILLAAHDRSIQIHACHSPMREVEVLHDQLLALFAADAELSPKDILVMMPDVESYAPFIQAVFDTQTDKKKHIPFSIADRNLRSASALIDAFIALLELQHSRFNVNEVLNLLEREVVYTHFGFVLNDLSLIRRWLEHTHVRWGIDAAHRQRLDLPPFEENTWRSGLQRLLLGYALPAQGTTLLQGILPFDEVEGSNSLVLGRFVSFVEELFQAVEAFQTPRTLSEWNKFMQALLERFFETEENSEAQAIWKELNALAENSEAAHFSAPVSSSILVQYLQQRLIGEPLPLHFLTGGVTFCAMLPMRSIPFKVICLLGMNDQDYPRSQKRAGFDLIAQHPKRGDRSRRDSDRYLFLEALLSARQSFYLSYVGHSIHEAARFPPSVLVSELQDYIRRGFQFPETALDAVSYLSTHHPLQPFSTRYFDQQSPQLFSYSEEYCVASQESLKERDDSWRFINAALPTPPEENRKLLELPRLIRFFRNPSEYFLKERLGIRLPQQEEILAAHEPFNIEAGLIEYQLNQQIVNYALHEGDLENFYPALKASGQLPHGNIGEWAYQKLADKVRPFVTRVKQEIAAPKLPPTTLSLCIGEWEIVGSFPKLWQQQQILYRYNSFNAGDYLAAWLQHLLLNAAQQPNLPRHSLMIGAKDGKVETCVLQAVPYGECIQILTALLAHYQRGLSQAVCFFPKSALSYIDSLHKKPEEVEKALQNAFVTWRGSEHFLGEGENPFYQICFGRNEENSPLKKQDFTLLAAQIFEPLLEYRVMNPEL